MKRVQLMVEASGLVNVEMSEEDFAKLEARSDDLPFDLDDVPGINYDDVLNSLDFELTDFNMVRSRRGGGALASFFTAMGRRVGERLAKGENLSSGIAGMFGDSTSAPVMGGSSIADRELASLVRNEGSKTEEEIDDSDSDDATSGED